MQNIFYIGAIRIDAVEVGEDNCVKDSAKKM